MWDVFYFFGWLLKSAHNQQPYWQRHRAEVRKSAHTNDAETREEITSVTTVATNDSPFGSHHGSHQTFANDEREIIFFKFIQPLSMPLRSLFP